MPKARKAAKTPLGEPLVGNYFHSLNKDGLVEMQGVVIGNPEPGWYLLQLFDWLVGEGHLRMLMRLEGMATWLFYADVATMKWSYEHGPACAGGPYRKRDSELSQEQEEPPNRPAMHQ